MNRVNFTPTEYVKEPHKTEQMDSFDTRAIQLEVICNKRNI